MTAPCALPRSEHAVAWSLLTDASYPSDAAPVGCLTIPEGNGNVDAPDDDSGRGMSP